MTLHSNLKSGDMFGRYRLEQFLGAGGFAVVWKVYDTFTNTISALKIFSVLDDISIGELADEYGKVHTMSHPNIVRADHFDSIDNIPYLVMKYCSDGSLERKTGSISECDVAEMLYQIADALVYVHEQGLVHQDIKPANILVDITEKRKRYLLSDFGISAKSRTKLSKSVGGTLSSKQFLTYSYAPPEKFSSNRTDRLPNCKGDIFSLGITAYELITGHLPFDELDTGRELLYNPCIEIDTSEIKNESLRTIISLCMKANPDDRIDAIQLKRLCERLNKSLIQDSLYITDNKFVDAEIGVNSGVRRPQRIYLDDDRSYCKYKSVTSYHTESIKKAKNRKYAFITSFILTFIIVIGVFIMVNLIKDNDGTSKTMPKIEDSQVVSSDENSRPYSQNDENMGEESEDMPLTEETPLKPESAVESDDGVPTDEYENVQPDTQEAVMDSSLHL